MPLYKFTVSGTATGEQTWLASGTVETTNDGQFMGVPMQAMSDAFRQVTQGRAVYGRPGVGCRGPYRVTRMTIEEVGQSHERPVHPAENIGSTTRDKRARPLGEVLRDEPDINPLTGHDK